MRDVSYPLYCQHVAKVNPRKWPAKVSGVPAIISRALLGDTLLILVEVP
jgi:hypothetical protein